MWRAGHSLPLATSCVGSPFVGCVCKVYDSSHLCHLCDSCDFHDMSSFVYMICVICVIRMMWFVWFSWGSYVLGDLYCVYGLYGFCGSFFVVVVFTGCMIWASIDVRVCEPRTQASHTAFAKMTFHELHDLSQQTVYFYFIFMECCFNPYGSPTLRPKLS